MKGARAHLNQRSLAFIVLIGGILGGLLIVFSVLLLCKYCLNRKNLREAEQMKLLYETLNQASLLDSNRLYHYGFRGIPQLEPRRSNPLDRYQLSENQWQVPTSQQITADYHSSGGQSSHTQSYHESREHSVSKQHDSQIYPDENDEEHSYLKVDPRCYVRQNSNASLIAYRKSDVPRLEKGHSLNVDTRPSPSSTSLSPHRQSSFDVTLAYHPQQPSASTPSPAISTQQDIYYTPRGSSLSVVGNPTSNTPIGSQHLSPPTPSTSRKNSATIIVEKKDLTATIDPFNQTSSVSSSIVQREHEYSRSLEHSTPPSQQTTASNYSANDKQSRSFDAVHLLRPVPNRSDVVNRRTKSYEYADDRRPSTYTVAPAPIVIKIPDMSELVQVAQFSRIKDRRDTTEMEEYQRNTGRKSTLVQQVSINDNDASTASQDLWRLRQSYEIEEQQRLERGSPEDFSPDLLTSTSVDSASAMPIDNRNINSTTTGGGGGDDDSSKYQHRRKSSSNLLLPPPEVRRQALRRTFEKRRSCINQSNARREQQSLNNNNTDLNDETRQKPLIDFSSLLNNFNSKSENSSFERSLETDFDVQSDTSSRGPNDQFTSIESSGNENNAPDGNIRVFNNQRTQQSPQLQLQQQQPQQQQSPQISPHQDDSGYKSLESQNSQNRTFSLGWMSTDGAESVIYVGDGRIQQRSVDVKDLDDELNDRQVNDQRRSPKLLHTGLHHSYQESSTNLIPPILSNSTQMQQRSLSTNIPLVDHDRLSPINLSVVKNTTFIHPTIMKLVTSTSFTRTASRKRREFGKDKRNASSTMEVPKPKIDFDEHSPTVHQINEIKRKPTSSVSTSSLQVRHFDLRRTKSDETRNLVSKSHDNSPTKESPSNSDETKSNNCLSSTTDKILNLTPIRQHLSPNTDNSRHVILQRSPSSTTPSVTQSPQIAAFRSQRSSLSFDHPTTLIPSPTTPTSVINSTKTKSTTHSSILPTVISKPRLKFSMVRDSAMASLGHSAPSYSMPITRDYSIDERTNRIVNEFLMHDPSLDNPKYISEDSSNRGIPKRHHHRIRPKTFDETTLINNTSKQSSQQSKSTGNKQRHHNVLQAHMRKHSQHQYASVHLAESIEQEEDSSDPATPAITLNQSSLTATRRENTMAAGSPSIIITGDDSGS